MKKSIILATALTAAILTVSLTACDSGKTDFNLSDYATALADSNLTPADNAVYTQSTKIGDVYAKPVNSQLPYAVVFNADGSGYKVRNLETGNDLASGKEYSYSVSSVSPVSYSEPFFTFRYTATLDGIDTTLRDIAGPDGAVLLSGVSTFSSHTSEYNVNGETRLVYALTYTEAAGSSVVRYYTYADPDEDGIGTKLKECAEDEFDTDDVTVGESFSYSAEYATELDECGKTLEGYTMEINPTTADGVTFTFYKDGNRTGSLVTGSNADYIGFLGDSFYYMNMEPVAASATRGYNVIIKTQYTDLKYNYTYYRYNIVKDKTTTVKTDYVFTSFYSELYNTAEEAYDRFYASAVKFENGVAVVDQTNTGVYKEYRLLLGEGLEVAADFTDKVYSPENIVKIAENRYLAQDAYAFYTYLLDGEENVLATYGTSSLKIYENSSLIVFSYNDSYMATDFDGKVVLGNKYENLTFYGDYAVTTKDGETVIVSAANPEGKTIDETVGNIDDKYTTVSAAYLSFGLITAVDSAEGKYVIFDLSGKALLTLDKYISSTSVSISSAGDYVVVCESISGDTSTTYVSYYLS